MVLFWAFVCLLVWFLFCSWGFFLSTSESWRVDERLTAWGALLGGACGGGGGMAGTDLPHSWVEPRDSGELGWGEDLCSWDVGHGELAATLGHVLSCDFISWVIYCVYIQLETQSTEQPRLFWGGVLVFFERFDAHHWNHQLHISEPL